jgi:hypothetical protein
MATFTTNANLRKPDVTEAALIGDINNNMDLVDRLCLGTFCTSGTRPSSATTRCIGSMIFETDTGLTRMWNGFTWAHSGGKCYARATQSGSLSLGSAGTFNFISFATDDVQNSNIHNGGSTPNRFNLFIPNAEWVFTLHWETDNSTPSGNRFIRIRKNGSIIDVYNYTAFTAGSTKYDLIYATSSGAGGTDYVQFEASSSVAGSTLSAAYATCEYKRDL